MRELLTWKEYYANGISYAGYLGKWRICTISYNDTGITKEEYKLTFSLPGLTDWTFYSIVEEAQNAALLFVIEWLISAVSNYYTKEG